jgi:hypothetical protein
MGFGLAQQAAQDAPQRQKVFDVTVANGLFDLQQERHALARVLINKLDTNSLRSIVSYMGEPYIYLYRVDCITKRDPGWLVTAFRTFEPDRYGYQKRVLYRKMELDPERGMVLSGIDVRTREPCDLVLRGNGDHDGDDFSWLVVPIANMYSSVGIKFFGDNHLVIYENRSTWLRGPGNGGFHCPYDRSRSMWMGFERDKDNSNSFTACAKVYEGRDAWAQFVPDADAGVNLLVMKQHTYHPPSESDEGNSLASFMNVTADGTIKQDITAVVDAEYSVNWMLKKMLLPNLQFEHGNRRIVTFTGGVSVKNHTQWVNYGELPQPKLRGFLLKTYPGMDINRSSENFLVLDDEWLLNFPAIDGMDKRKLYMEVYRYCENSGTCRYEELTSRLDVTVSMTDVDWAYHGEEEKSNSIMGIHGYAFCSVVFLSFLVCV